MREQKTMYNYTFLNTIRQYYSLTLGLIKTK